MLPVKGSPTTRTDTVPVLANDRNLEHEPADFEDDPGTADTTGIRDECEVVVHDGRLAEGVR